MPLQLKPRDEREPQDDNADASYNVGRNQPSKHRVACPDVEESEAVSRQALAQEHRHDPSDDAHSAEHRSHDRPPSSRKDTEAIIASTHRRRRACRVRLTPQVSATAPFDETGSGPRPAGRVGGGG